MTPRELELINGSRWVLLDFDGPVCSAFAGYPAPDVAAALRERARRAGVRVPVSLDSEADPMQVLRALFEIEPDHHADAEATLAAAELRSVAAADPSKGAVDFMRACQETNRPLAVVSNNSPEAVRAFLDRHELADLVIDVAGRDKRTPELMKPHPHLLRVALDSLGAEPAKSMMVGDTRTDVEAAHTVGVTAIGYANEPGKVDLFQDVGADVIVEHLTDLAAAVRTASA